MSDETGAVNALMQIVNGPGFDRAFEAACELFSCFDFFALSKTPQNPAHHGEGDVLTHTRMVCRALWEDKDFQTLGVRERALLFPPRFCTTSEKSKPPAWKQVPS